MSEVFLCRTGQLTAASKRDLKKAGIVVVEVEDPSACEFIRSGETIAGDDMLWACLDALRVETGSYGRDQRDRLAQNLLKCMVASRTAKGQVVR